MFPSDQATREHFHLTVQHKSLFRLFCSEAYQYAHRGTIHLYQMEVERFDGYNGPITLQIADRQIKDLDGADVLETTIPAGETRFRLPLYLPETMHINVQAHSNIYAQGFATFQDRWGNSNRLHRFRDALHGADAPNRHTFASR